MVKKGRSNFVKKTHILKMLPTFYQTSLENNLTLAEYLFLQILINLLQAIKKVSLESLATALPIPILFESRRKKIQRFLSLPCLSIEKIWLPIVTHWLSTYFQRDKIIYVAMDRTSWGQINLFMVSVIWDKRAFPIYWTLLPKDISRSDLYSSGKGFRGSPHLESFCQLQR